MAVITVGEEALNVMAMNITQAEAIVKQRPPT
jgi:hypothetical protein